MDQSNHVVGIKVVPSDSHKAMESLLEQLKDHIPKQEIIINNRSHEKQRIISKRIFSITIGDIETISFSRGETVWYWDLSGIKSIKTVGIIEYIPDNIDDNPDGIIKIITIGQQDIREIEGPIYRWTRLRTSIPVWKMRVQKFNGHLEDLPDHLRLPWLTETIYLNISEIQEELQKDDENFHEINNNNILNSGDVIQSQGIDVFYSDNMGRDENFLHSYFIEKLNYNKNYNWPSMFIIRY